MSNLHLNTPIAAMYVPVLNKTHICISELHQIRIFMSEYLGNPFLILQEFPLISSGFETIPRLKHPLITFMNYNCNTAAQPQSTLLTKLWHSFRSPEH